MKRCWVELSGAGRVSKLGGSSKQKHKKKQKNWKTGETSKQLEGQQDSRNLQAE